LRPIRESEVMSDGVICGEKSCNSSWTKRSGRRSERDPSPLASSGSGFRQEAQLKQIPRYARDFACGLPQNGSTKTGAYSPPRFSAPALKPFREIGRTRPLIYFRPTCSQSRGQVPAPPRESRACRGPRTCPTTRKSRVSGAPDERSLINPRCLAAVRRVNSKAGARYLLSR
jgi:hypothetical protein